MTALLRSPLPPHPNEEDATEEVPGYELMEIIGRGGMGVVYRAIGLENGDEVAIKLLPRHLDGRDDIAARFVREAEALSALNHPHILRVLDRGVTPTGRLFLVTELAKGGDLACKLKVAPLPPSEAFRLFHQVLGAIGEAHDQGIAHRDIKPANILLSADGNALVGDFSLAKLLNEELQPHLTLTQSNDVFGTPYYIAPEVRRGAAAVDERADIFSLGVLLHEMLTGRLPIGNHEPASRLAGVPSGVDDVISHCLQEDPAKRPSTAGQIARELTQAQSAPRRWREASLVGVVASVVLLCLTFPSWHRLTPAPTATTIQPANREKPWINSLGMPFVPVSGTRLLFCQWETRRQDFGQFAQEDPVERANPRARWRMPLRKVTADHPITPVSYNQAVQFCDWLTKREHKDGTLPAASRYRLPTDEEWSAAATLPQETGSSPEERSHNTLPPELALYAWGRSPKPPKRQFPANFAGQEVSSSGLLHTDDWVFTAPIASFASNANGLYDLSGNVAEWCSSNWSATSNDKVLRGGSWNDSNPAALRLDYRVHFAESDEPAGAGFRLVICED